MIDLEKTVRSIACKPLRRRRWLLRSAFSLMSWTGRPMQQGLTDVLQRSLHLSRKDATRIDHELLFQDWLQAMEWLAVSERDSDGLREDERHVTIDQPEVFERLAATGQPVILAPLHMGIFSLAVAVIVYRYFQGRKLLILRAREDRVTDTVAMRRLEEIAPEIRILNVRNKDEHMDALRYARDGAVIICFADLPESYGTPADVTLFSEPARIALGIDSLARIVKGYILPMAVRSSVTGDTVLTGQAFEVLDASTQERQRIAQLLVSQIQQFIYDNPAHWHMWPRLSEYRPAPVIEDLDNAA